MLDLKSKSVFLIDLDDTLINTYEAMQIGLRRAYQKLAAESEEDLSEKLPLEKFEEQLRGIYNDGTDEDGKKYFDYRPKLFEDYCNNELPKLNVKTKHVRHSLAARIYWQFKETKYAVLMPRKNAFGLLCHLALLGPVYCITQGKCNYQHTKAMLTDLEGKMADVVVTEEKERQLRDYVELKGFPKEKTIMIGDSRRDIVAGKNAGVETVLVKSDNPRHEKDFEETEADAKFNNLLEIIQIITKN